MTITIKNRYVNLVKPFLLFLIMAFSCGLAKAATLQNQWFKCPTSASIKPKLPKKFLPSTYFLVQINLNRFDSLVADASNKKQRNVALELPMPKCEKELFTCSNSEVMDPKLSAKYPQIKSFKATAQQDQTLNARIDRNEKGLFIDLNFKGEHWYAQPIKVNAKGDFIMMYPKKAAPKNTKSPYYYREVVK